MGFILSFDTGRGLGVPPYGIGVMLCTNNISWRPYLKEVQSQFLKWTNTVMNVEVGLLIAPYVRGCGFGGVA